MDLHLRAKSSAWGDRGNWVHVSTLYRSNFGARDTFYGQGKIYQGSTKSAHYKIGMLFQSTGVSTTSPMNGSVVFDATVKGPKHLRHINEWVKEEEK